MTEPCEGYLAAENLAADELREIFGVAMKMVLNPRDWDYKDEIRLRSFRGKSFEGHPVLVPMITAFRSMSREQLQAGGEFMDCVRYLVHFDRGLARRGKASKKVKRKVRKARITRVGKEFRDRLRRSHVHDRKVAQGLMLFMYSVKSQFLGKGKQ